MQALPDLSPMIAHTGYRRTVDLALPETENRLPISIDQRNLIPSASANQFDLPPIHILSGLLDVYYQHVHPSYPVLPCRTSVDAVIISPSGKSDIWSTLMLSVCAYSGRLSVSANPTSISSGMGGLAGMIAADLWYEQARTSLSVLLKKESSLELMQATLLLALRDYGKGSESQAWVLVGKFQGLPESSLISFQVWRCEWVRTCNFTKNLIIVYRSR